MDIRIAMAMLLVIMASGCVNETRLPASEASSVLDFSDPVFDGLMSKLNANDYVGFSAMISEGLRETITEQEFSSLRNTLSKSVGYYMSRQSSEVYSTPEEYVVVYQTTFEHESPVSVRVSYQKGDPYHIVQSLFITSDSLRQGLT